MSKRISVGVAALTCAATALHPGPALAKTHHHHADAQPEVSSKHTHGQARAKAAHLARLAAQEKAAWRRHLAKVRELPRQDRLALKRHERHLRAQQADETADRLAAAAARSHRLAKAAKRRHVSEVQTAKKPTAHAKRLAQAQAAHSAHLSNLRAAHQAAVAAHNARLAKHQNLLVQKALQHQARAAKLSAAHNAAVAAQHAHWVALHGDGSGGRSIKFWQTVSAGVPVKVVTVDLNDSNVKVSAVMARRGTGTAEPFRQMIERANPNVAVTGTFFSLDNLRPVGDIVIDGSLIHFGGMGTALCVTPDNHAEMVTCEWGRHHDWSSYDFVVACGPRLLRRGRVVLNPPAERFRDRHMLAPNSRIAVGITRGNKIVFVMTHKPIYLGRLAKVMRSLGTSEAMNLDAGTSTGFYYNGATLAHPGRNLTNMIVVYGHKDRYERALDQLVPASYRRASSHYGHRQAAAAPSSSLRLVKK